MTRRAPIAFALVLLVLLCGGLLQAAEEKGEVVNINTASEEELTRLPRVGPALASRIVEYREANGSFETTDELIMVRGIGETTYKQLEPYVTLDGDTTLKEPVRSSSAEGRR